MANYEEVSAERFIDLWQTSDTFEKFLTRVKVMSPKRAAARYYFYKKRGVQLNPLCVKAPGRMTYDWKALALRAQRLVKWTDDEKGRAK